MDLATPKVEMNRKKRERRKEQIKISLEPSLYLRILRIARSEDRSPAQVAYIAMKQFLAGRAD